MISTMHKQFSFKQKILEFPWVDYFPQPYTKREEEEEAKSDGLFLLFITVLDSFQHSLFHHLSI